MSEEWMGGLSGGLRGLNDWLMAMIAQRERGAQRKTQDEDRDFQRLGTLASLRRQGVVPQSEAQDTPFEIPNVTGGAPLPSSIPSSARYSPFGEAGGQSFVLDTMNTPEARERKRDALGEIKRRANQTPRNIDPLSPDGIRAAADRAKAIAGAVPRSTPTPKIASPADEATSAIQAAGGDVGQAELGLANDPNSAWRKMTPAARVRLLRAAADRYKREGRLDSSRNWMGQLIMGQTVKGLAPNAPAPEQDDAAITDDEIVDAMANGADSDEAVREYVKKKRGGA